MVIAAILAFIAEIGYGQPDNFVPTFLLAIFGSFLSLFGLFMVIAFSLGHQNYIMNIVTILCTWDMEKFYKDWEKPLHFKRVHRWFFEFTLVLFVALALYSFPLLRQHPIWLILVLVIVFVHMKGFYWLRWEREFKARKRFIEELHPGFKTKMNNVKAARTEAEEIMALKNSIRQKRSD